MNEISQLPAKIEPAPLLPTEFNVFGSVVNFTDAQRMAKALCSSSIVPENYRGEAHIGDCLIALEISNRIGANILSVMQNLYIVHGKPAWSSQFLIACVNASRRFSPLRYKMTGDPGNDSCGCIAWATDKTGEVLESPEITIGIAKAEGWFQKNGSKWKTMPALMLRYRAATLFARLYAPELSIGIQTADEVADIIDVAPIVTESAPKALVEGEKPKKTRFIKTPAPVVDVPAETPTQPAEDHPDLAPTTAAPTEPTSTATPPPQPAPATSTERPELTKLQETLARLEITEPQLIAQTERKGVAKGRKTLAEFDAKALTSLNTVLSATNSAWVKEIKEAK